MRVTASQLRADVYNLLDSVLESSIPVEVVRNGRVLRIVADKRTPKLARLKRRDCLNCDPADLIHRDWTRPL